MKKGIITLLLMSVTPLMTATDHKENDFSGPGQEEGVYPITKVTGRIDWDSIPALPVDKVSWTDDAGIRAQGQICHDSENLYVRMSAAEKHIRAENTTPLSPVHEDSCLEFFFKLCLFSFFF